MKVVSIPVIGVGGIQTGEFIDQGLQNNFFVLAAVGRAILDGPKNWGDIHLKKKNKNGDD